MCQAPLELLNFHYSFSSYCDYLHFVMEKTEVSEGNCPHKGGPLAKMQDPTPSSAQADQDIVRSA